MQKDSAFSAFLPHTLKVDGVPIADVEHAGFARFDFRV
jgi:predicted NAD-dependent protein-ADP-ribosyltransferase YbiA (DUF1768 family)